MFGPDTFFGSLTLYLLAGVFLFLSFLKHLFTKERRRREALEIVPPEQRRLLRPPGCHLQERLFAFAEQQNEEVLGAIATTILATLLLAASVSVVAKIAATPSVWGDRRVQGFALLSAVGFGLACFCGARAVRKAKRLLELSAEIRRTKLGLRGEQAVAEALQDPAVVQAGYFTFHDVPLEYGGNIDHVVVGPGGVFMVETKTRSQQKPLEKRKRNRAHFDGDTLRFPWGGYDRSAAEQTKRNADALQRFIRKRVSISVEPVLVLPGWEVHMERRCEIMATSANGLRHLLSDLKPIYTQEQLEIVMQLLDERCRTVEF